MNRKLKFLSIATILMLFFASSSLFAQWAKKAVSGANGNYGNGVVIDGDGNSYVVGRFSGTANFAPGGSDSMTVMGSTDVFFAKYNPDGDLIWAKAVGGSKADKGYGIALDGTGGLYISGYYNESANDGLSDDADFDPDGGTLILDNAGEYDMFLGKYNTSDGALVWAESIGGPESENAYNLAVAEGFIYVVGRFQGTSEDFDPGAGTANLSSGSTSRYDAFFAKYKASDGSYQWAKNIGAAGETEYAYDLAVDASGNMLIVGVFQGTVDFDPDGGTQNLTSNGERDVFFAKYAAADGSFIWAKHVGTAGSSDANDYGYGIDVDPSGNVYITGKFEGTGDYNPGAGTANITSDGGYDTFIAKYNSSGDYQWVKSVGGTESVYGLSIISDGTDVYVSGTYKGTSDFGTDQAINLTSVTPSKTDIWFGKYSASNGASSWAKSVGGSGIDNQEQYGNCISMGSFHITGYFDSDDADFDPDGGTNILVSGGSYDVFNAKYLEAGGGLPVELTSFTAESVDGGVLLSWETATEVNNYGFEVEASDDNSNWNKIGFVEGHGNSNAPQNYNLVASIAMYYRLKQIDTDGSVKYSDVVSVDSNLLKVYKLDQNYPNPFNPTTVISYSIPKAGSVSLRVYNALGQEVANLVSKTQNAGNYKVEFDASKLSSGIYIYTLESLGFTQSNKMLLIK